MSFQLSPPGSPGCAIVLTRQAILPGVGVEADDLRAARLGANAGAGGAHHDLPARREDAAGDAFAHPRVADARVPHQLAGLRVERDDVGV